MSDRELLELAAKAVGYVPHGNIGSRFIVNFGDGMGGEWNPLEDDGDALRILKLKKLRVYVADDGEWLTDHQYIHNLPDQHDCWNCFEGKSDMDHTCKVCGGSGIIRKGENNEQ